MTTYQLSCTIGTTDPAAKLGLEIWLDNYILFGCAHITDKILPLKFDIEEDEATHELRFVMTGKTQDHTKLDDAGNIIQDASLIVKDVAFDEIELKQIFVDHAVYTHNFNGTQEPTAVKFYGEMGCNGTVGLKFTTPIYLWLLESM